MDELDLKLAETEAELEAAIAVRMRVFVVEQEIPAEEELDQADATASHVIARYQGQVIGTGRLVLGEDLTARIGRMAVDQPWRRQGVGGLILQYLETEARVQGMLRAALHAQEYVKDFYAAHGYREHGDVFLEVDIPHIEMRKEL